MTQQGKILAEFRKDFPYKLNEVLDDIESFISTKIHEAVTEERERVRVQERVELLLELLQVFNDYDVPLTMTAEQVREILKDYLNKKD